VLVLVRAMPLPDHSGLTERVFAYCTKPHVSI
jgi:hypothetical protein